MTDPTLAQLWSAGQACDPCGRAWGSVPDAPEGATHWRGTCHLCGVEAGVTHVRRYGYLQRGMSLVEGRNRG